MKKQILYLLFIVLNCMFLTCKSDNKLITNTEIKEAKQMVLDIISNTYKDKNYTSYYHTDNMMVGSDQYKCIIVDDNYEIEAPIVELKKSHPFKDEEVATITIKVKYLKLAEFDPYKKIPEFKREDYYNIFTFIKEDDKFKIIWETNINNQLFFKTDLNTIIKKDEFKNWRNVLLEISKKI